MAKLADAADLKSAGPKRPVGVRFPLPAPLTATFAPVIPSRPAPLRKQGRRTTYDCAGIVSCSRHRRRDAVVSFLLLGCASIFRKTEIKSQTSLLP